MSGRWRPHRAARREGRGADAQTAAARRGEQSTTGCMYNYWFAYPEYFQQCPRFQVDPTKANLANFKRQSKWRKWSAKERHGLTCALMEGYTTDDVSVGVPPREVPTKL
jgi:hypothetical protein